MAKKKTTEKALNIDNILFNCRDYLRAARNSGSFFEKRDMMLTLVFLRFIGEKYEDGIENLKQTLKEQGLDPEDENIRAAFFDDATFADGTYNLPPEARWSTIISTPAPQLNVALDTALQRLEEEDPQLKGCFVKGTFTARNLAANDIKKIVDEVNKISHKTFGEEKDLIGRVYEYFLKEFAVNATKEEGEFYTPHDVVQLIATMIEPYDGTLYDPSMFVDVDYMKYSIIKAINVYRPQNVIEAIYKEPQIFVKELRSFLEDRIIKNQANTTLKEHENQAFEEILILLEDTEVPETLDWSYFAPFDGFKKLLTEMNVNEYQLMIDREGKKSHTLNSAMDVGLENVTEEDSKDYVGIRMADLLVGLISRLMQSLKISLTGNYKEGEIKKTLLDSGWFALNQRQLDLYKKLYRVICENNDYWYKSYSGIYSDDLVAFVALFQFVNHFSDADEIRNSKIEMQPEYYNAFVCESLNERYKIMRNKLPIDPIVEDGKDYFYNQRGAKVYKDINKQPMLPLHSGQNEFYVLSVGFSQNRTPLVTISENDKPICYRLPNDYSDWTMTVAGVSSMGERLFPSKVLFSLIGGRYLVDIL